MPYTPPSPYPTVDNLADRLTGSGVNAAKVAALKTGGALAGALASAIGEWEGAVGWSPYLSPGYPETRHFDPPTRSSTGGRVPGTRRLDLRAALQSLTSLTVSGSLYTSGQDFHLRAYKASGVQGTIYDAIDFPSPLSGPPQSIAITGVWGRVVAVPEDVKNALLTYALSLAAPDVGLAVSGGLLELQTGDITRKFGSSNGSTPLSAQSGAWGQAFARLVKRDKRITL